MVNVPVYIFSGFLDSGKTKCIKETLLDTRFNEGEKSLIIALEEGDEEYEEKFLKEVNASCIYLDSLKLLTFEKMEELDKEYKPERVFIELNGMEDDRDLYNQGLIRKWEIAQTLTVMDATKFQLYVTNMKQFVFNHIYNAELCVFNRVDGIDRRYLRNNLKAINPRLEIIYEDLQGNVTNKIDDDMFDVTKPINLSDNDYGLWYMDAVDHPDKYENAEIEMNLKYIEPVKEYEEVIIMGRKAMVCCAQDITNISITVVGLDGHKMKIDQFYHIKGKIHCLDDENGYKTCVLYASEAVKCDGPIDEMVYFN